jgi:hypothetical protein
MLIPFWPLDRNQLKVKNQKKEHSINHQEQQLYSTPLSLFSPVTTKFKSKIAIIFCYLLYYACCVKKVCYHAIEALHYYPILNLSFLQVDEVKD